MPNKVTFGTNYGGCKTKAQSNLEACLNRFRLAALEHDGEWQVTSEVDDTTRSLSLELLPKKVTVETKEEDKTSES